MLVIEMYLKPLYSVLFNDMSRPSSEPSTESGPSSKSVFRSFSIGLPTRKEIIARIKNKAESTIHKMMFML